jgi:DNA-directed RNA polymerase specialized sigma24 family protein
MIDDPSKRNGAPTGPPAAPDHEIPVPGPPGRSTVDSLVDGQPPERWSAAEGSVPRGPRHRQLLSTDLVDRSEELVRQTRDVEHAEQLAADAAYVRRFRETNCLSDEFRNWLTDLINSTTRLLISWCKRGLIFKKTHATLWPRTGEGMASWDKTELLSLVGEVQARAAIMLRDRGIRGGLWDPKKGATLRGYFLRGCIRMFASFWPTWSRQHEHWAQLQVHPDILQLNESPTYDFTGYEFDHGSLIGLLSRKLTNEQFEVLAAKAEGYTNEQMAEMFGVSPNAIAQRLRRARREAKKHVNQIGNIEEGGSHA